MKSVLAVVFMAVFAHASIREEEGVLVLDDSNFDSAVKDNEFLLVEFYAPWCGHCKKLAPEWASAAQTLKGSNIKLAKVDATEAKELGTRFAIKGFPTIKIFKHGTAHEYQGGRSASEIVSYARKQTGPAAETLNSVADLDKVAEANEVFVVGYFKDTTSAAAKTFLSIAGKDDDTVYVITSNEDVKNTLALSSETVVIVKGPEEDRAELPVAADFALETASSWIAGNKLPLINEFSSENAKKIFGSTIKKHALFFTSKDEAHHAPTVEVFRSIATAFRGQVLVVRVPSTESRVLDYFGIKADNLPAFVAADMGGEGQMKKFFFDGKYEVDSVTSFVSDFLGNKLKAVLKSETVAPEDTTGPVKVVKGSSFNDIVINNGNDVLIEFYAPWCGHCKKLAPTWDELAVHLSKVPTITIAKSDATANEFDLEGLNIKGFPTIYFFKGTDKKPVQYNGGRELEDFVEFLSENAATPFEHSHSEL